MRFSKMIPKDKVSLINEEQSKRLTTICFKRKFVHTSLADSDCSSLKSKRDAETTKSPLETIDVHMSTEKVKTLLNLNIVFVWLYNHLQRIYNTCNKLLL